ncbi:MAG: DUF2232 domain-containing protein [Acidobacteria bacterium]|nr:DUF2232 domain-containing protein [Acidobacteriota bacterium]
MQANDQSAPAPDLQESPPRIPRLGAAASGLVALLLVGGLFAVPILGLLIAPLGLIPVLHFQAGGSPGIRAWGPVVVLLAMAAAVGAAGLALPLLAAYFLIIVLPAVTAQAWVRWSWSDNRWVAVTTLAVAFTTLAMVAMVAQPLSPVEAVSVWLRAAAADAQDLYAAWGLAKGEMELALDAAERMASWLLPSIPVAYLVAVLFWVRPRLPVLGLPREVVAFEEYRNDEWLLVVFAAAGIGTLLLGGTARWLALNTLIAVLILYFVQGLAIIRAHLARFIGRGWLVRWGVALLCLQMPLPLLVAVLGVADNFHSLRPRANDDGGTQ